MASLPKLRPFSPSVRNDFNNPRRFPDNQGRQPPSSDPNNQYRDPLLSSYLGKGARLASIDSYHDYPEDNDSLSDHTLLPSDTRCPLIAEDDGEFLSDTPPAILEVAPSIQCPYPSNLASTPPRAATEEDAPNIEEMEKPGAPKPSENFVHSEVIASPSRSLDKFPSSPSHGFPYDDRANTMSTVCSSQQPPAYSVADTSKISSRDPETMSPFHRFRSAAVGVHAAVRLTRMQRLTKKAKWASKKFIVFTLSKVGLTCVVAAYVIFGAFLFAHLESHELEPQTTPSTVGAVGTPLDVRLSPNLPEYSDMEEDVLKLREKYLANMWNTTIELNVFYFDLWHENIKADLEGFERGLLEIVKKHSLPGLTTAPSVTTAATINTSDTTDAPAAAAAQTQQDQSWSYATALLFCVAVVTTIGYGDIVPTTPEGKVACMFYALIGIPMMLLCLANIGHFLAACFRFLWQHARLLCLVKEKKNDKRDGFRDCKVRVPITIIFLTLFVYLMIGASLFSGWEEWSFLNGSYFVFVTLSTIGFGDFVPGKSTNTLNSNAQRVVCALYLLFGLSLVSMTFQLMQEWFRHIMARYAEFFGLTKEQIDKDKEVGESGIVDVTVEDAENRRKLLEDASPGGHGAGYSDVVVVGDGWGDSSKRHGDGERSSGADVVSDADSREGEGGYKRVNSKNSNLDIQASQKSSSVDIDPEESHEGPQSKKLGDDTSNALLEFFKKRRPPQDRSLSVPAGSAEDDGKEAELKQQPFSRSQSADPDAIVGDRESNTPTAV